MSTGYGRRGHPLVLGALVALMTWAPAPSSAQPIFGHDFESGLCSWGAVANAVDRTEMADPCEGIDNDCDGLRDENAACDDGISCTTDSCNGASGCGAVLASGNCLISGDCYLNGTQNPFNECQLCNSSQDQQAWSNQVDGTPCSSSGTSCVNGTCQTFCFAAGTLVPTATGLAPIEAIAAGTLVPSYSPLDGTVSYRPVRSVERYPAADLLEIDLHGETLVVTPDHPMAVAGHGWIKARELVVGDALLGLGREEMIVQRTSPASAATAKGAGPWVYNLRVEGFGTYFVGRSQVLVNSCSAPLDLPFAPPAQASPAGRLGTGFPLLIYDALAPGFTLVSDHPTYRAAPLACLPVGRWALRAGIYRDHLALIDNDSHSLLLVPLAKLRQIAAGELACPAGGDVAIARLPLRAEVAYGALIVGDRLYVSYFARRDVDVYRISDPSANRPRALSREPALHLPGPARPGASSLVSWHDRIWVADVNWACDMPRCSPRFDTPRLFSFATDGHDKAAQEARPAGLNASSLFVDADTDRLYVIAGGDPEVGGASLQRMTTDGTLAQPLPLPRNAAVEQAFKLPANRFLVLQMSGAHVFIFDAAEDRLVSIQRLVGERFEPVSLATIALPERDDDVLRDAIADPGASGHFYLVDSKGGRLFYVDATDTGLEVLGWLPVANTSTAVSAPNWGISLRDGPGGPVPTPGALRQR